MLMDAAASPTMQAFLAGLGPFFAISLGAAGVFLRKQFSRKTLELMLGAAAGMMLGATFWALIIPSLELSAGLGKWAFMPTMFGLILGALFLRGLDAMLPHTHDLGNTTKGITTNWHRSILLITAMALHHIPEGLALGVSAWAVNSEQALSAGVSVNNSIVLLLSIMLQGVPEGLVVAMALRAEGISRVKSFFWGTLSGVTTPIGALLGSIATGISTQILPLALAFAAGAMLHIIVEDLVPESQREGHGNNATIATIAGLILVMIFQTIFA